MGEPTALERQRVKPRMGQIDRIGDFAVFENERAQLGISEIERPRDAGMSQADAANRRRRSQREIS